MTILNIISYWDLKKLAGKEIILTARSWKKYRWVVVLGNWEIDLSTNEKIDIDEFDIWNTLRGNYKDSLVIYYETDDDYISNSNYKEIEIL